MIIMNILLSETHHGEATGKTSDLNNSPSLPGPHNSGRESTAESALGQGRGQATHDSNSASVRDWEG